MVQHLLNHGAHVDPPKDSLNAYGKIYQSPLGLAVKRRNETLARLLIDQGANVNIEQSRAVISLAACNQDLPMVDLLLKRGAQPDQVAQDEWKTALLFLMGYSGRLMGWPQDEKQQTEILRREANIEKIVRRLIAGGAEVNFVSRICTTAYLEASNNHSEGMKKLLVELGADPELHKRCRELRESLKARTK